MLVMGKFETPVDWHMLHSEASNEDYKSLFTMKKTIFSVMYANLEPFQVFIVNKLDDTSRGDGGFGSTGK